MELKNFSEEREIRAKAILEQSKPEFIDNHTYLVTSQFSSNKKYTVTFFDSYSCNCFDFQERCQGKGLFCKHIKAIIIFKKMKNTLNQNRNLIFDVQERIKCPFCQSDNLIKSGLRKTKIGNKQRYECRNCNKRCVLSPIPKIKGNTKLVCLAMDCYFKGLSFRDISDLIKS
jgi:transposase-like protein